MYFISLVVGEERIVLQPHALEDPPVKELIKVHTTSKIMWTSVGVGISHGGGQGVNECFDGTFYTLLLMTDTPPLMTDSADLDQ